MTRWGQRWTDVEVAQLCELRMVQQLRVQKIASILGRTFGAVHMKCHAEGFILPIHRRQTRECTRSQAYRLRIMWKDGVAIPDIVASVGCSRPTFLRWRKELGLGSRLLVRRIPEGVHEEIKRLRARKYLTSNQIARKTGCTRNAVIGYLWRRGLMGKQREGVRT